MIVKDRIGNWALRVYLKNPGEDWFVSCEQYYPTRAEMREGTKLWKHLTRSSVSEVKIKHYRIRSDFTYIGKKETSYFVSYKDA